MPAEPLRLLEREEIRAGIERGDSLTQIACGLGRHRCTVSAEVTRNGGRDVYKAVAAQARADKALGRPKFAVLVAYPALAAHVTARLRAKDSPMTISVELSNGIYPDVSGRVSHETIYQSVYAKGTRGLVNGHWFVPVGGRGFSPRMAMRIPRGGDGFPRGGSVGISRGA